MAEEEVTAVGEAVVEAVDDDAFRSIIEIDDDVAAEDHVELAKEGDAPFVVDVEAAERDAIANGVTDLPRAVSFAREVTIASLRRRGTERVLAVLPLARSRQHLLVQIAAENLERALVEEAALIEQHRDRV